MHAHWPSLGVVEFINVDARYREDLNLVLQGVSFKVESTQKIGVVGRTGAGKSTITLCLLRVIEILNGHILIDGMDISQINLEELRNKITIIQQDPQLFSGTIK